MLIGTPITLFSAISLLFLVYTQRALAFDNLVRNTSKEKSNGLNLRGRFLSIWAMQLCGMLAFILSVISIILVLFEYHVSGSIIFAVGLCSLAISLVGLFCEILLSLGATENSLVNIGKL
jgi:hypothetical protein